MPNGDLPPILAELIAIARNEAEGAHAEAVEPLHLFIAACKQNPSPVERAFSSLGIDPVKLRRRARGFAHRFGKKIEGEPQRISSRVMRILADAKTAANADKREPFTTDVLVVLLHFEDKELAAVVQGEEIPVADLEAALKREGSNLQPADLAAVPRKTGSIIDQLGRDYTQLAREGKLDPVIGRRDEIKQIIRVLLRKQKNNPVLIGEAGVGKTSVVEGLAQFAAGQDAPADLRSMKVVEIQIASLVAGAKYRGDLEERLQKLVQEAEADKNLVLFFDEIHTIVGAGGGGEAMDAANILKPALARGSMRCIGATTFDEYRRHIEKDPALERRFQPIRIEEPSASAAREILAGLRPAYEEHHQVRIADDALDAAVELSVRYITDRRLPDKARDALDQACVNKRVVTISPMAVRDENPVVTAADVATVVAEWTGVPVERLTLSDRDKLAHVEDALARRVIGQDDAIATVARVVRTAMAGMGSSRRPHGVLLFVGPTGVGKTELARALAEFLFEDEDRMIRFDMSEYMEEHSVSKLIGSPPGYVGHDEGGRLTDSVRRTPYAVLLFDEIEKAHPKIFDLFLQVFDDGRLTDSRGRLADFRNTFIILTSNAAVPRSARVSPRVGFARDRDAAPAGDAPRDIRAALAQTFRPELLNRLSEIVEFRSLGADSIRRIIDKLIDRVRDRVHGRKIAIRVTPAAYDHLMEHGYAQEFGAREMERLVERDVVQSLAEELLAERWAEGSTVVVDAAKGRIVLRHGSEHTDDPIESGSVIKTVIQAATEETDAMLLIDMVRSTRLVLEHGDTAFMTRVRELHDRILGDPDAAEVRYIKSTGDGFLMLFAGMGTALAVARRLRESTARENATRLRLSLHWGRLKIGPAGDPLGTEVHRLFRIDSVTPEDRVDARDSATGRAVANAIVITRAGLDQLPASETRRFESMGRFRLEGFDEPEELWIEG